MQPDFFSCAWLTPEQRAIRLYPEKFSPDFEGWLSDNDVIWKRSAMMRPINGCDPRVLCCGVAEVPLMTIPTPREVAGH